MCLYSKTIKNRRYIANKKNKGIVPQPVDERLRFVEADCGNCIECRQEKSREWQIRLNEDIKTHKNGQFVTLTFSNQEIAKLYKEIKNLTGYNLDNKVATLAVRRFLERYRKHHKKSIRHWLITELGHNGTKNIHLHGILFTNETLDTIEKYWKYGWIWKGEEQSDGKLLNYVNQATIGYITKYITKRDEENKTYKPKILATAGMGQNYLKSEDVKRNKYNGKETRQYYKTTTGHKIALPKYWRRKIYTEEEREKLTLQSLDENTIWICGEKIDRRNEKEYFGVLKHYRNLNIELGYGTDEKNIELQDEERERRIKMQKIRVAKGTSRTKQEETAIHKT